MRYLVIDLTMPKPHEKYTWSPRIEMPPPFLLKSPLIAVKPKYQMLGE